MDVPLGVSDACRHWYAPARRIGVEDAGSVSMVSRTLGEGDTTTFLHGFPTCSFDWHRLALALPSRGRSIFYDLLGFGLSDKPRNADYSIGAQLDRVVKAWKLAGVRETAIVAHDYSTTLVQEALARMNDGTWHGPRFSSVTLLNGGLYPDLYHALPIQKLLLHRATGPMVAALSSKATFVRSMRRIAGPAHPPDATDLHDLWTLLAAGGGKGVLHLLSRYQEERRTHAERWTTALRYPEAPIHLVWGAADPISGSIPDAMPQRAPRATVTSFPDVGHYPQLEVPRAVAEAMGPSPSTPQNRPRPETLTA